jgi:hypothetical protein
MHKRDHFWVLLKDKQKVRRGRGKDEGKEWEARNMCIDDWDSII